MSDKIIDARGEVFEKLTSPSSTDFSQAELDDGVIWHSADNCIFRYTSMNEIDGTQVKFTNCIFAFCDMHKADFSRAEFINCEFIGCYMKDAKFEDARFTNTSIRACLCPDANFSDTVFEQCSISGNFMRSRWDGTLHKEVDDKHILLAGCVGYPG